MFQLYVDVGCVEDFDGEKKCCNSCVYKEDQHTKIGKCLPRNIFAVQTKWRSSPYIALLCEGDGLVSKKDNTPVIKHEL